MTIGAAGGPKIITQVLLGIIRHIDYGEPIDEAVGAKRFHHQWRPNRLMIERGHDDPPARHVDWRSFPVAFAAGVMLVAALGSIGTWKTLKGTRSVA